MKKNPPSGPAHRAAAQKYDHAAHKAAAEIIKCYSSSFSLAASLLREPVRTHVRSLYAMVRVADEIVDGAASGAGLAPDAVRQRLDAYEQCVFRACETGFSTDPIAHAFGLTARHCGIASQDIRDFFTSMREDTRDVTHDAASVEDYVHGSAEVIGLMCNAIFAADSASRGQEWSQELREQADTGAIALGRAFQKVNFLRDLAEDIHLLGRHYVCAKGGVQKEGTPLSEAEKAAYVAEIRADLELSKKAIGLLPLTARAGVAAAHGLFAELTELLDQASVAEIMNQRVRVPGRRKALISVRAAAAALRPGRA